MKKFKGLTLWWDTEFDVARAKSVGVLNEEIAYFILEEKEEFAKKYASKMDWIVDLSEMENITSKARKVLAETAVHPSIRRYAFVGASIFIRTIANFISAASGQKNIRHFVTDAEALEWLSKHPEISSN